MRMLLLVLSSLMSTSVWADHYIIDSSHTYPQFLIRHLNFAVMHGRFNETTGTVTFNPERGIGAVEVVITAASIDTGHAKRDEHLRNADFFDVEKHPQITYRSTQVHFEGNEKAMVEGELVIKGVKRPVTLTVDRIYCGTHPINQKQVCSFDARANIKRSDFGISYGLPVVPDDVELVIGAEAVKE